MATKLKNFTELIQMVEAVKRGEDKADGDMLNYIDTLHGVIKGYEIDIESLINRYNKNTKRHGN